MRLTAGLMPRAAALMRPTAHLCAAMGLESQAVALMRSTTWLMPQATALMRLTARLMPRTAALMRPTAHQCAAMGLEPHTALLWYIKPPAGNDPYQRFHF